MMCIKQPTLCSHTHTVCVCVLIWPSAKYVNRPLARQPLSKYLYDFAYVKRRNCSGYPQPSLKQIIYEKKNA